jgi:hypothetical protein
MEQLQHGNCEMAELNQDRRVFLVLLMFSEPMPPESFPSLASGPLSK